MLLMTSKIGGDVRIVVSKVDLIVLELFGGRGYQCIESFPLNIFTVLII